MEFTTSALLVGFSEPASDDKCDEFCFENAQKQVHQLSQVYVPCSYTYRYSKALAETLLSIGTVVPILFTNF